MTIFLFFIVWYILESVSLFFLFPKAGVPGWKGLVPGLNFVEWCKIIGQPTWHAALLLIPIVNIFVYAGMEVDMVRSFGRFRFWHSALAVIYSPIIFWMIAKSKDTYLGPTVPKENLFRDQLTEAYKKNDKIAISRLEKNNPYKKGGLREWVEAVVFAVFAAAFIRMFLIEAYVIPTSSMEGSLLVGDFLFVSKAHYGIRTPQTVLQIPLLHNRIPYFDTESYLRDPSLPYYRLPALESVERNAPFVFNYPPGDSVFITPERTFDKFLLDKKPENYSYLQGVPMTTRPMDKEDFYIKRCVAVAGDTLEIKDRQVYINGARVRNPSHLQYTYQITGSYSVSKLEDIGVHIEDRRDYQQGYFNLDSLQVEKIKAFGGDVKIVLRSPDDSGLELPADGASERPSSNIPKAPVKRHVDVSMFPHDTAHFKWALDNYGPLYIPKKGATVQLTPENIAIYRRLIPVYENNTLEEKNGKFYINGQETTSYTFKHNYYWAMGDNRHNSEDSRFWGFVPEMNVVGKPLFIWFSTKNGSMSNGINWSRIFTTANKM